MRGHLLHFHAFFTQFVIPIAHYLEKTFDTARKVLNSISMTINLKLSHEEEIALRRKARAAGIDVAAYALRVLRSNAKRPTLDEVLAPVRANFKASGLTDEQVAERYEAEKHAERAARRGKPLDE